MVRQFVYSLYLFLGLPSGDWPWHHRVSSDCIGWNCLCQNWASDGIGKASGGFTSDPQTKGIWGSNTIWRRKGIGKASGNHGWTLLHREMFLRHREIMVKHSCVGKCCFHFVPLFILQQSGEKITGTWLVVGLCAMASWLQKVNHLRLSWHAVMWIHLYLHEPPFSSI